MANPMAQNIDFTLFNPGSKCYSSMSSESQTVVAEVLKQAIDDFNGGVCTPNVSLQSIADRFTNSTIPEAAMSEQGVVDYFKALERDAIKDELHLQSPSMIGHMTGATLPWTSSVAQLLSLLNLNVVKCETAKCGTFVERETVGMLHRMFFQQEDAYYESCIQDATVCLGHVTSGGTVANIEALWCARNTALPGVEELGLPAALQAQGYDDAVIICSRLAHYSVSKACGILGLGTRQMITLPVNHDMSVNVDKMREALEDCQKRKKKVLALVALAGSTECGSFDDITAAAALAKEYGVWLHVDAAWGGGLIFSQTAQAKLFAGVDLADSVTIDAHKQLFTPMGFGMVLYRNENIAQNITKTAQYIIRADSSDLGRFTMEGSRPAIAHYLRANLYILGREGFAATMDRKMQVTQHLATWLREQSDFDLLFEPQADILLCRYVPQDPALEKMKFEEREAMLDELTQRTQTMQSALGRTFVSRTAVFDPRSERSERTHFFRIVVNAQISEEDAIRILKDTRWIAQMLSLDAKPIAEATTLTQALAHAALHDPEGLALECDGERLSFQALFERVLAVRCKLSPSSGHVPILADSGLAARIAVLAVLLNGSTSLLIDAAMSAVEIAQSLEELQVTDVLVASSQLTLLAEVKSHLSEARAGALRALTLTSKASGVAPPCPVASLADPSRAVQTLRAGSVGDSQRTELTQQQLLRLCEESTISSALDRLVPKDIGSPAWNADAAVDK